MQPLDVICRIAVIKNFSIFTGKHLCRSLLLIKSACNFIIKRLQHRYFPVNIAKYLLKDTLKALEDFKKTQRSV